MIQSLGSNCAWMIHPSNEAIKINHQWIKNEQLKELITYPFWSIAGITHLFSQRQTKTIFLMLVRQYRIWYFFLLAPGQTYWTFHWATLNIYWVWNVQSVWPPCWALFTLVESCSVKFDRDQSFHWTNVERLNISFVFQDVECCSVRLTSHWTFVQFVRAQWVIVSAKFSLVQQNGQHVWPPSNWTSLSSTQLCWTNVQCCSVIMFSTFDRGLTHKSKL